ncbi:MAG: DUF1273 family protein [Clostridia bacterium]|nr:DUF1273 family protein [Clostridia bacterium]
MNRTCTCCFTGHRDLPPSEIETIQKSLRQQVETAIHDGYRHFLCGMANGADLLFAQVVAELKSQYLITLEAAIPYQARLQSNNPVFRQLLPACDIIKVHSPIYHGGCYQKRNRYMVEHSSRIIAVYNGEEQGGTHATLQYARQQNLSLFIIPCTK